MKVLTNAFWLSFSRLTTDLLSFALFAVIARAFGPSGTGEYSYGFAVATLVALISTSGFDEYGIRQYTRAALSARGALWQDILSTQLAQLVIGAGILGVLALLGVVRSQNLAVVLELSLYVIGWSASRTFFIPAMAAQAMIKPALTDLACRVGAILSALLLAAVVHPPLPWMLIGFPIAGVVLSALALRDAVQRGLRLRARSNRQQVLATLRGTLPFTAADVLNQFYARVDVVLIAYLIGTENVGLYATDIKFVEVGLLPLILLGSAAYPLLVAHAVRDAAAFREAARDFTRVLLLLTGWLAVTIFCLVPLIIVPLFGTAFAAAIPLLPLVALFAVLKGAEAAFYRLLYAAHQQSVYLRSLAAGTVLIIGLNLALIPTLGLRGAIVAAIVSTIAVDVLSAVRLAAQIGARFLLGNCVRLGAGLVATAGLYALIQRWASSPWVAALAACGAFPLLAALCGLVPDPRHSELLRGAEPRRVASR
jgi:O-antigen/teichoic acid export membrane protein